MKTLTEPQTEDPHKTCNGCGYCLTWITNRGGETKGTNAPGQTRRLTCLLCKARTAIRILAKELEKKSKKEESKKEVCGESKSEITPQESAQVNYARPSYPSSHRNLLL